MEDNQEIKIRDQEAEKFEQWYLKKGRFFDWIEKKLILKNLNLSNNDIILDAGCGTGRITKEIAKKCKKVYGVDFSPLSIKELEEKHIENIETFVSDLRKTFDQQFDKILSIQVIQHIPGSEQRLEVMRNFYKQLKPNGKCLVSVYNYSPIFYPKLLKQGNFPNGLYYFRFTPKEIKDLFEKSGFRNISVRGCVNFRGYSFLNNKLFYVLAKLDVFLSKLKLSCFSGHFLICQGIK